MASWVESWSSRAWSGATAVAVGAPLLATLVTTGIVDAVLVAAALGAAIAAGWVVSVRRSLDALPVELAPQAAVGPVDGVRTVRVRFRLGRGRTMADVAVRVVFAPADGPEVALAAFVPPGRLCGPVTAVIPDPEAVTARPGTLRITVAVVESGRTWTADGTVAEQVPGRFRGISSADWAAID